MKSFLVLTCLVAVLSSAVARKPLAKFEAKRDRSARIIGGDTANAGQYPSVVAMYINTADGTYFCGGSLVSDQYVLTAAHCLNGAVTIQVMMGSTTLQGNDPNRKTVSTSTFVTHPDYDPETLQHDVGMVKFHLPIAFSDYIKPVYLPTVDLVDDMTNIAVGWGATSDDEATLSNDLKFVSVTSISNVECQLSYGTTIFETMVCVAGNYNEGACRGDLGSPLMTTLNHHHWHTGISTFISTNGCESTDPSGYTRTFTYIAWIKETAGIV